MHFVRLGGAFHDYTGGHPVFADAVGLLVTSLQRHYGTQSKLFNVEIRAVSRDCRRIAKKPSCQDVLNSCKNEIIGLLSSKEASLAQSSLLEGNVKRPALQRRRDWAAAMENVLSPDEASKIHGGQPNYLLIHFARKPDAFSFVHCSGSFF